MSVQVTWGEVGGAVGDLGTFIPLLVGLAVTHHLDVGSTLAFTGVYNIVTGALPPWALVLGPQSEQRSAGLRNPKPNPASRRRSWGLGSVSAPLSRTFTGGRRAVVRAAHAGAAHEEHRGSGAGGPRKPFAPTNHGRRHPRQRDGARAGCYKPHRGDAFSPLHKSLAELVYLLPIELWKSPEPHYNHSYRDSSL